MCVALLMMVPAPAGAAEPPLFDATLSLTGDCFATIPTGVDPVPDPGCPGGAHPPEPFKAPKGTAVDRFGNRYVASYGNVVENGAEGRIDVFDDAGNFITEVRDPNGPVEIAVDSDGNLYAIESTGNKIRISRYPPSVYHPAIGEIAYEKSPELVHSPGGGGGIAVNPTNDHLFFAGNGQKSPLLEFGSAAEGNPPLFDPKNPPPGLLLNPSSIAIDGTSKKIYADAIFQTPSGAKRGIQIFDLEGSHELLGTIDGSSTPDGLFLAEELGLAVDEESGNIFAGELSAAKRRIQELKPDGSYVSTIEHSFEVTSEAQLAVDNSTQSASSRYLFVSIGEFGRGRSYAFAPRSEPLPPAVGSVAAGGVTEDEAVLNATVLLKGQPGQYRFELTSAEEGFEGAEVVGEGTLKASREPVGISAVATGLVPGTPYRFRVIVDNGIGTAEKEGRFTTFGVSNPSLACPNEALRVGRSAELPDCRAYELVTPPSTNGLSPYGLGHLGAGFFPTWGASPAGDRLNFRIEGGSLPGIGGTGTLAGDPYLAARGPGGWSTVSSGPTGSEAPVSIPGGVSPDQTFSFFQSEKEGSLAVGGEKTTYVRYPDGHFELIGRGSIAENPRAAGLLISENGEHIIFAANGLEPNAPPDGTGAIYDRTSDGVTHVVSLLPEDQIPAAGQGARYVGASLDGEGVAFEIEDVLYLRHDNEETYEIGENITFAGLAEGGERLFYLEEGDLKAFDIASGVIPFSTTDVTVVNISADGSTAYFISNAVLPADSNPRGDLPLAGAQNLYRSREGVLAFVGAVLPDDVSFEGGETADQRGLGNWTSSINAGRVGRIPSRTTPDGEVLLFEASAPLGDYDPQGHSQIYRYDFVGQTLRCISCKSTGTAATGEAVLQSMAATLVDTEPLNAFGYVANLRADGNRAFFESTEALVLADQDGQRDVYEWEEEGAGSCRTPGGCVYLISSGASGREDYLYAVSESGNDVFFRSSDLLLPADADETPSIYDARVGGGFPAPPPPAGECLGEACQPTVTPPGDPVQTLQGKGNVAEEPRRRCAKGKRAVRSKGKQRCVRPAKKRKNRSQAGRRTKS